MKKLFAILLTCLLLTAPAVAEELYTFAGVPWDTPISECEALLEANTGVGFEWLDAEWPRVLAVEPGFYSVLGIHVLATYEDIAAWYSPVTPNGTDNANWALNAFTVWGMETPGAGVEEIRGVWDRLAAQYGEPSRVYFVQDVDDYWSDAEYRPYSVPQEEWPYILEDVVLFARATGSDYRVQVHFCNVVLECSMYQGEDGLPCYYMNLVYNAQPVTPFEEDGYEVEPFPMYNGDYIFTVIEPW